MKNVVEENLAAMANLCRDMLGDQELIGSIEEVANLIVGRMRDGNKLMVCGNGGSAADAQHIAAELTGKYLVTRAPFPAMALTTDTSALTAIGNDIGFDLIFSRQVDALGKTGDVLLAISTSGKSSNIIHAMNAAQARGVYVIGLTGQHPHESFESASDICLKVPATLTPAIQQAHILIGHTICEIVEKHLA